MQFNRNGQIKTADFWVNVEQKIVGWVKRQRNPKTTLIIWDNVG